MSIPELLLVGGGAVAGIVLALVGYTVVLRSKKRHAAGLIETAQRDASQFFTKAKDEADKARAAALVEGKMEALKIREEFDRDLARRREEVDRVERRLEERERGLTKRSEELDRKSTSLNSSHRP